MNKVFFLTTLASLGFTSVVNAADNVGTTYFVGSVTDTTCSIVTVQNGVEGKKVDVGTYSKDVVKAGTTTAVDFSLKGVDGGGVACTPTNSVDISWLPSSGLWSANGLENTGSAQGVVVKLMDKDSNAFNAANFNVNYDKADVQTTGEIPFKAQLIKNGSETVTAGTVIASAIFSVAYK